MKSPIERLADSQIAQVLIALLIYSLYACVLGLALAPAIGFFALAWAAFSRGGMPRGAGGTILLGISAGAAYFIFLISATIVMGGAIRLLSCGIKPGRYAKASPTMLRWLLYSGIYNIAYRLVLPIIPISWFSNLFFIIVGCKMGRGVYLNSWILNDAFLIEIGDNVTVGGGAEISCHLYEGEHLILDRVKIGSGSMIGANSYIAPGVEIGEGSVIGLGCYLRRGARLPPGSRRTRLGALSLDVARRLERGPMPHQGSRGNQRGR